MSLPNCLLIVSAEIDAEVEAEGAAGTTRSICPMRSLVPACWQGGVIARSVIFPKATAVACISAIYLYNTTGYIQAMVQLWFRGPTKI